MVQQKEAQRFSTLTDFMRYKTSGVIGRIGHRLHRWGIHPDFITLVGFICAGWAGFMIAHGEFFWAAIIIMIGIPLDALDGAVARAMKRRNKFGALWDSSLDRYADGLIFTGLVYYFSIEGEQTLVLLSMIALLGTELVSYVRARAEALDLDCKVGLFTRMERVVVILAMLFTGWVLLGLWVLAVGTNFTVIQRIWHVNRSIQLQRATEE